MKKLITTLFLLTSTVSAQGRFAVSHDGNYHDKDDIGAVAMVEALIWKAGVQDQLVHLDYSSHIGATDLSMENEMSISAERALSFYGIDQNIVFDGTVSEEASNVNLAQQIDLSSKSNRLTIIQAGPWEMMARAFDLADPNKHRYVTILSHSDWNDEHKHFPDHRNKDDFFAQYQGGWFDGYRPPGYTKIVDQNFPAFHVNIEAWDWLDFTPYTDFVLQRTIASGPEKAGDMSDAGMMFYYLTGNETPSMPEIQEFFDYDLPE